MANEENKQNGMDEGMQVVAFKLRNIMGLRYLGAYCWRKQKCADEQP